MQCYVTFDATTHGIRRGFFEKETLIPRGAYIFIGKNDDAEWFPDKNWFIQYKSAIKNAEKQRQAKIQQLEKQIERIKNIGSILRRSSIS